MVLVRDLEGKFARHMEGPKDKMITFRLTAEELEDLRLRAWEARQGMGDYLMRQAGLRPHHKTDLRRG